MKFNKIGDVIVIDKPSGITPLQAIQAFKKDHTEYVHSVLSYAGRLDPMAEGVLLILVGDENKKRHAYEHLSKTYEFSILIGYSTDSYDVMGKVTSTDISEFTPEKQIQIDSWITSFTGIQQLYYPPYSSKPVNGKPLYWYAKRNQIDLIERPIQRVEITSIEKIAQKEYSGEQLFSSISTRIALAQGDFRQSEIIDQWKTILGQSSRTLTVLTYSLESSSGTYVRGIVNALSEALHIPMLTFSIKRTQVGEYSLP